MTHNETVEKFVHDEAKEADCEVADGIDKVKVFQYFPPWFRKCAMVSHHADG